MPKCIAGREAVIRLRRKSNGKVNIYSVICPEWWTKAQFAAYVRREHPNETLVVLEWKPVGKGEDRWEPRLWMVNPREMVKS